MSKNAVNSLVFGSIGFFIGVIFIIALAKHVNLPIELFFPWAVMTTALTSNRFFMIGIVLFQFPIYAFIFYQLKWRYLGLIISLHLVLVFISVVVSLPAGRF